MVDRDRRVARILSSRGCDFVMVDEVMEVFALMSCPTTAAHLPPYLCFARIDDVLTNPDVPLTLGNLKWAHFIRSSNGIGAGKSVATTLEEKISIAQNKLGEIFCKPSADIDATAPLVSMGLDSLIATEFLNFLKSKLGHTASYADILSGSSLQSILQDPSL